MGNFFVLKKDKKRGLLFCRKDFVFVLPFFAALSVLHIGRKEHFGLDEASKALAAEEKARRGNRAARRLLEATKRQI